MIYIKLDDSMNLVITVNEPIYRGDNLNQKIIYLIPLQVGEIDMLTATPYLSYIRADGVADIVRLERQSEKYKEAYYQYVFPVSCRLTKFPGEVCSWLQIFSGTPSNPDHRKEWRVAALCRGIQEHGRLYLRPSAFGYLRDAEEDRGHGEQYGRHPRGD